MNKYRDWVKTICSWISFLGLKSTLFSEYVWTDYNRQNRIECINRFQPMIDYEFQPIPHHYWTGRKTAREKTNSCLVKENFLYNIMSFIDLFYSNTTVFRFMTQNITKSAYD